MIVLKRWHLSVIVLVLVVLAASLPVGVMAATGSFVNIRDYSNTGATGQARVQNGHLVVESCDSTTTALNGATCARYSGGREFVEQSPAAPYAMDLNGSSSSSYYPSAQQAVPTGKRFQIDYVTGSFGVPSGQSVMYWSLRVTSGGVSVNHELPLVYQGTYSGNNIAYYAVSGGAADIVADAGTLVKVEAFRSTPTGTAYVDAHVSGHLV